MNNWFTTQQPPNMPVNCWRPDVPVLVESEVHGELIAWPVQGAITEDGVSFEAGKLSWICCQALHDLDGQTIVDVKRWRHIFSQLN